MAFCGSCGKPTGPDDHFCMACGAPVKASAPATPPASVAPPKIEPLPAAPVVPTPPPAAPAPPVPQGTFCGTCGKQVAPGSEFCPSCGAPLRQQAPGGRVVDPTGAMGPARRSHVGLWLLGVAVVLILLVVVFAVVINSGPKPEDSLDQARAAYLQHDQASFDKYVDVNSVLSDWTDQGVNVWLKQQNAGAVETAAAQIVVGSLKSAYLPGLAQSVDQMVVSGTPPDQSPNGQSDPVGAFVTGFVSSIVRSIASSQLTYQGVQSKTIVNNTDATLRVNVLSSVSSQPVTVQIRMRRDGDHWRVIAIDDLAGLLNQMGISTTP